MANTEQYDFSSLLNAYGISPQSLNTSTAGQTDLDQLARNYDVAPQLLAMNNGQDRGPLPPGMLAALGRGSVSDSAYMSPSMPQLPGGMPQNVRQMSPGEHMLRSAAQGASGQNAPSGADLQSMLSKYQSGDTGYGAELKAARAKSQEAQDSFNKMLDQIASQPANPGPSKAEMYFKLASALSQPTKTGSFAETLGNASNVLGAYGKEQRLADMENRQNSQNVGLQRQKLALDAAKADEGSLRQLASEELKLYIQSGQPQSVAGKAAMDMGLRPGTPEYQAKVAESFNSDIDKKLAQIQNATTGLSLREANLKLAQSQAAKLTPTEIKIKNDLEDRVNSGSNALPMLKRALELNSNSFDNSTVDTVRRKALEVIGSNDPKLVNTKEMENLLSSQGIGQLKSTFGGNPTEGERKALLDLQGMGAKSKDERAVIIKNAVNLAIRRLEQNKNRLNEISSGKYRIADDTSTPQNSGE